MSLTVRDEVLEYIRTHGPSYAVPIGDALAQPLHRVHAALHDLRREGLLTSEERHEAPGLRGGRPRTYYSLTVRAPDLPAVLAAFEAEATEREARAANPDVVGAVERDVEEMAVRTLRRVVAAVRDAW